MTWTSGAWGTEITAENAREGHVDDGLIAYPERVDLCRRHWPEGQAEDFEPGRRGRWTDKATGTAFRESGGCGALMSPTLESIDLWFVRAGKIVLLVREERAEQVRTIYHGPVRSGEVIDGRPVWSQS